MNLIKFAGLVSKWTLPYAKAYADGMFDMNLYAKALPFGENFIVAYSTKPFTVAEAAVSLSAILAHNTKGETQKDAE